ncbi:MAG: type II toxin-antitoxin system RelE/ParE family toxin [Chitinophagales bacterium]|nr:type II toxin-antitoxin system RelE/ParE family toxin [Chitinophagales bacterium]
MTYSVEATPHFRTEAKRLSKKYRSLKEDIATLAQELAMNPRIGTGLGGDVYKVRLSITSKGKGKSGGARVITCVKVAVTKIYLVSIYDKSEKETARDNEIRDLVKRLQG